MCGCRVESGEKVIDLHVSNTMALEDGLKGKLENQNKNLKLTLRHCVTYLPCEQNVLKLNPNHFLVEMHKHTDIHTIYTLGGGGLAAESYLTLGTPWTVACQAPLSMGFSR